MEAVKLEPFLPEAGPTFADYSEQLEFYFESVDLDLGSVFSSDPDYAAKVERLKSKRRAVLLSNCGPKCFEVLKSLAAPTPVKELSFEELIELGVAHFDGAGNPVEGRYKFCCRRRGETERFAWFHADLKELAKQCNFGRTLEERLRDQIVCGVEDEEVVARLVANKSLSYEEAVEMCSGVGSEFVGELVCVELCTVV